jgi:hypothetical protein
MAREIVLSGVITGSTTDLLQATRLQTVPARGKITIQVLADLNNATNNYTMTVQTPSGETPIEGQRVPGANPSLDGVLDERQLFQFSTLIAQGGHIVVSFTETGTAILTYRVVYTPM